MSKFSELLGTAMRDADEWIEATLEREDMKYVGSKNKYAYEILPIILDKRQKGQVYVEPFVGGANIIDKVTGPRIASDINTYLIELLKAVQSGYQPPDTVTEQEYQAIKSNPQKYPKHLVAFVAIGCSYSGKWFGGYARGNSNNGNPRNYCQESKRNILNQVEGLKGIQFESVSYENLKIPDNSIIYCDPPYANTVKYKDEFDSGRFWDWCLFKWSEGHSIFISEYTAPSPWRCVWERQVYNTLDKNTGAKVGTERLFTY